MGAQSSSCFGTMTSVPSLARTPTENSKASPFWTPPPHLLRPPQLSLLSFGEPAAEPRSRSSNVMPETLAALAALTALGLARRALPALARHALLAMTALGDEKPWVAILVQT